jgi:ATP synthase F1 delta subunit
MAETTINYSAIADVYAEGLLKAADEQNAAEEVAEQFRDLIAYMDKDADFKRFLTAESVDDDPRRVSLEKLFRGRMHDLLLNMLQVMNNRNRLSIVRQVYRCVELRMEARHQQVEVTVETAKPLGDDMKNLLQTRISEWVGKEALLIEDVDPELIGGIVVSVGDMQVDASVLSQVRRMSDRLNERATREIPAGTGIEV